MEKLDGKSLDLVKTNIEALKQLFPEVVTEGKIDFEKLKLVLGEEIEKRNERYEFTWYGKTQAMKLAQTPSTGTLRPDKESSKNWDTTENLYIEGDNLEVLKLLQKSYFGKIKMIYIDPPYNTGKDFVYKDDFRDNIKNYKEITQQTTKANTETSGRYHTDWLNMMYPRLKLARNLLREDGVIFISIDDNEAHNLRKICDEIFGEENLVEIFYIQVRYANKSLTEKDDFQKLIEQVLVYKKGSFVPNKPFEEYSLEKFKYKIIEKGQGRKEIIGGKEVTIFKPNEYEIIEVEPNIDGLKETWASGTVLTGNASGKYFDKYLSPRVEFDGLGILYKVEGIGEDGLGYRYFTGPKKEGATKGKFYSGVPLDKREQILKGEAVKTKPIINFYDFSGSFGNIRHEGGIDFRAGKKPVKFIRMFIDIATGKDDVILDFFGGSSSTAHAVIDANAEDNGNRKFIIVQLPEKIDENTDYKRAGFSYITDLGKERIRRAGDKIVEETGKTDLDIGFKVFKLDSSNVKPWDPDFANLEQTLFDLQDNIKQDRTKEDLLYEILLKIGLPLTTPIEEIDYNGKTIYNVGFGSVLLCLEDEIDLDIVNEMMKYQSEHMQPKVIFKESGFINDSVKTNAIQTLKKNGITDVRSV